jgi:hypothetical protein
MSHREIEGVKQAVLSVGPLRGYMTRPIVLCSELVSAVQLRVQLRSINQREMEVEESPLLIFGTRKRLVKIFGEA